MVVARKSGAAPQQWPRSTGRPRDLICLRGATARVFPHRAINRRTSRSATTPLFTGFFPFMYYQRLSLSLNSRWRPSLAVYPVYRLRNQI